ncbi:hypothetical protein AC791_15335 [Klebsiella sp. RIT-PI-d]|nr:hypothetical protein AC791_15335 [Klebsiella sp. RIT-PI-d]
MEDEAGDVVTLLYDAVDEFTARKGEMIIREMGYYNSRMIDFGPAYAGLCSAMSEKRTSMISLFSQITDATVNINGCICNLF